MREEGRKEGEREAKRRRENRKGSRWVREGLGEKMMYGRGKLQAWKNGQSHGFGPQCKVRE